MKKYFYLLNIVLAGISMPISVHAIIVQYQFSGTVDAYEVDDEFATDGFQSPADILGIGLKITTTVDTDVTIGVSYGPWAWDFSSGRSLNVAFDNGLYWNSSSSISRGLVLNQNYIETWIGFSNTVDTNTNMPVGLYGQGAQLRFRFDSNAIDVNYFYNLASAGLAYRDELFSTLQVLNVDDISIISSYLNISNVGTESFPCNSPEGFCFNYHEGSYSIYSSNISSIPLPASVWMMITGLCVIGTRIRKYKYN